MSDPIKDNAPRWTWAQISQALASMPDDYLLLAGRAGYSNDEGCRLARAKCDDHVRRHLVCQLDDEKREQARRK